MARIPEDETPQRRRVRPTLPVVLERPTRVAFLVILVAATVLWDESVVRAVAGALALGIFYGAGWSDGRRDAFVALLGGRNARRARPPVREGDGEEGE
jgi:hypothetical protein